MAIIRIPALIDPHIHLIETAPASWRELASAAGVAGYCAIQVMPDLDPPIMDKVMAAHYKKQMGQTAIPVFLTAAGTPYNISELKQLRTVNAIKVWLGTGPEELIVTQEEDLRKILLATDKIVMIHAEDETTLMHNYAYGSREITLEQHGLIFNRTAAIRATVKAITAAKETGRKIYLCHISTGEEVELVRQAKSKGIRVFAEVAPHHLFLTEDDLERLDGLGKVNPPLRTEADQEALWQGIAEGTIDTIGSDSHSWLESEKVGPYDEIPSGLPNIDVTLPILLTAVKEGRVSLQKAIELTSTNPAKIFSIPKPSLSLFVDMDNPRPIRFNLSDWHPYEYEKLIGWPIRQVDESFRTKH